MYGLGFYWLVNTMVDFGHIPLPLSLVFFVIIAVANGLRMGLLGWWVRSMQFHDESPWWCRLLLARLRVRGPGFRVSGRVFPWYLGFLQYPAWPLSSKSLI